MKQAGKILADQQLTEGAKPSELATIKKSLQTRSTTEEVVQRRSEIARLIDRLFTQDKNQSAPDDDLSSSMTASWDSHLTNARAPTERLEEIYELAIQQFDRRGPFGIFNMLGAWATIQDRELSAARVGFKKCYWDHIDEEMNVTGIFIGTREEATLPCPTCRPMAFEVKRQEMIHG